MRIGITEVVRQSNSFSNVKTTFEIFRPYGLLEVDDVLKNCLGAHIGGNAPVVCGHFVADTADVQMLVLNLGAPGNPLGPISRDLFA